MMRIVRNTRARVLALGLLAVTFNEATGYQAFNIGDSNIACTIDPTCRKLTDEEISLAKEYFGDTIDYSSVNYFTRAYMWGLRSPKGADASSTFGNIYENNAEIFDRNANVDLEALHVHEMTHVWQYQQGHWHPLKFWEVRAHDNTYDYTTDDFGNFLNFGIEQQASIMQDLHFFKSFFGFIVNRGNSDNVLDYCENLNALEELVAQELPLEITDCSQYIANVPEI